MVIVFDARSVPIFIAPVPVFRAYVPLVVVIVTPPVPVLIFSAVAPVTLPIVMVFALAPVPIVRFPVVPESTVKAEAAPELRVIVPDEVSVVEPLPVRVGAALATVKRVVPAVSNTNVFESVVPILSEAPSVLPPLQTYEELTVQVVATELLIVIPPEELVILMPVPAVKVDKV
jgi:hypothetical protein